MLKRLFAILSFVVTSAVSAQTLSEQSAVDSAGPTKGRFIKADEQRQRNPKQFSEFSTQSAARESFSPAAVLGWSTSIPTSIRMAEWNRYYFGPYLRNTGTSVSGAMNTLTWTVNVSYYSWTWPYPIEVFVLGFDAAGTYLGYVSVGYIQSSATTRVLDLSPYGLPMNTQFQYAFIVHGGGSPYVENPPTITRVTASVN